MTSELQHHMFLTTSAGSDEHQRSSGSPVGRPGVALVEQLGVLLGSRVFKSARACILAPVGVKFLGPEFEHWLSKLAPLGQKQCPTPWQAMLPSTPLCIPPCLCRLLCRVINFRGRYQTEGSLFAAVVALREELHWARLSSGSAVL